MDEWRNGPQVIPELRAASSGGYLRLRRLFDPTGQVAVIVPLDQGIEGDFPELERAPALVGELVDAGATAFIMRRGMARQVAGSFCRTGGPHRAGDHPQPPRRPRRRAAPGRDGCGRPARRRGRGDLHVVRRAPRGSRVAEIVRSSSRTSAELRRPAARRGAVPSRACPALCRTKGRSRWRTCEPPCASRARRGQTSSRPHGAAAWHRSARRLRTPGERTSAARDVSGARRPIRCTETALRVTNGSPRGRFIPSRAGWVAARPGTRPGHGTGDTTGAATYKAALRAAPCPAPRPGHATGDTTGARDRGRAPTACRGRSGRT